MKQILFTVTKDDLEITYYTSPGPGGQKKNKTKNAVRMKHPESGAMVTAQERKERSANLKEALHRLVAHPKFIIWHKRKVWEIDNQKTVEEAVEEMVRPENLRTEVLVDNKWIPWSEENVRS